MIKKCKSVEESYNITSNTLYCYIKVNERSEVWEDACLLKGQKSEVMIVATEQIKEAQLSTRIYNGY